MRKLLFGLVPALLLLTGCKTSVSSDVAATVNGRPITYNELDKEFASQFGTERPKDDQMTFQKLEILRSMIDAEIMLQRAEKLSLMATDSDVEAELSKMKTPYTQEEFQRQLTAKKMTVDDLRARLRRDLSIQKLFNKEITSKINITDKDVSEAYNNNKADFNFAEPRLRLAQILVTPGTDAEVRNLKNDDAKTDTQALDKMRQIEARLKRNEDFGMLAQNLSEDPQTAQNGGDLGYLPESALDKADPNLRKLILSLQAGQVSPIQKTAEGYRIFKMIAKEPAGQRELTDPRVQQSIRETLLNRKDQLLKNAYYEVARNEAKVANYLALSIAQPK